MHNSMGKLQLKPVVILQSNQLYKILPHVNISMLSVIITTFASVLWHLRTD